MTSRLSGLVLKSKDKEALDAQPPADATSACLFKATTFKSSQGPSFTGHPPFQTGAPEEACCSELDYHNKPLFSTASG